ncbi:hypothetical protein PN498_02380 [Oscillatoria sp. CS-180]|uniref:hypothetical protein n=1 Tax=Oscillatoria sp. CS-180 TaxID=3021720 RepID=UPI00232B76A4|nr:hypothetical protein [Oscillatoria sp. CS-180]MDB9524822.1 hypothetical protein [Oscillatoria sp. CS-180]
MLPWHEGKAHFIDVVQVNQTLAVEVFEAFKLGTFLGVLGGWGGVRANSPHASPRHLQRFEEAFQRVRTDGDIPGGLDFL